MIFKLNLIITFSFGTMIATAAEKGTRFSVDDVWKKSKNDCTCKRKPVRMEGVQKYYDDVIGALDKFPPGPLLDQADSVKTTFQNYISKIVTFSNANSTVLSSGSIAILEVLSNVDLSANTPIGVIKEFYRMLPSLAKTYKKVVSNLSPIIGELSCSVNRAITDLQFAYKSYMEEFLEDDENGLKKELEYEPITKRAQKLTNTISTFADSMLNKCEPATQDAIIVLTLVLDHLMICDHGLSGCSQAILFEQNCKEPVLLQVCHVTMGVFVNGITESIVEITPNNEKSVTAFLRALIKHTDILNSTLNKLFGLVEGVANNVGPITKILSKSISGTVLG